MVRQELVTPHQIFPIFPLKHTPSVHTPTHNTNLTAPGILVNDPHTLQKDLIFTIKNGSSWKQSIKAIQNN